MQASSFSFPTIGGKKESDLVFWSFYFTASSKLWVTINAWYYSVHPQCGSFQSHINLLWLGRLFGKLFSDKNNVAILRGSHLN
jgi:hypothetical protein